MKSRCAFYTQLRIFGVPLLILISMQLYGQTWEEQSGEIEEAEVVIEKNIKIELPFAARNFGKIPPQPIPIRPGSLNYSFLSISPEIKPVNPRLRAVTISDEEIRKLYGGYFKVGFGNYITPLVDAYLFTKRNEKFSAGVYGNYLAGFRGPVDKDNSASSDLSLGATGSLHGEDYNLKVDVLYNRLGRYFYGYPDGMLVERDTIHQVINRFGVRLDLKGELTTSPWLYKLGAGYKITKDDYDASESQLEVSGGLGYKTGDDSKVTIDAQYNYILRDDELINKSQRSLLNISPAYQFIFSRINVYAGLNFTYENDTIKGFDKLHVYPNVKASYDILDALKIHIEATGGINNRNLDYWLNENPLLNQNVPIYHSNTNLQFGGGFSGQIVNPLGFNLGASVASIKNMPYILNDSLDMAKFTIVYDSLKTSYVRVNGELSLQKEKAKMWLRGNYHYYKTGAMQEAWHKPQFDISLGSSFNIYDKIIVSTNFNSLFGIKAYDPLNQIVIEIDPVVKLDLEIDYRLSKIAGIFIQANNIAAVKNTTYYRYPSRGLQIIGGINLSF